MLVGPTCDTIEADLSRPVRSVEEEENPVSDPQPTTYPGIDPLCKGKPTLALPRDGICFWYEEGEIREGQGLRITRVGANRAPGCLHDSVKNHYELNREGSIFRKHLGGALMARDGEAASEIKEWGKARRSERFNDQKFHQYEARVTVEVKRGTYRVLNVDNAHERRQLKEKLIAIFSHCNHCRPSKEWLGNHAYRNKIRQSGLWNVRHVCSVNEFRSGDLSRLQQLVNETLVLCQA